MSIGNTDTTVFRPVVLAGPGYDGLARNTASGALEDSTSQEFADRFRRVENIIKSRKDNQLLMELALDGNKKAQDTFQALLKSNGFEPGTEDYQRAIAKLRLHAGAYKELFDKNPQQRQGATRTRRDFLRLLATGTAVAATGAGAAIMGSSGQGNSDSQALVKEAGRFAYPAVDTTTQETSLAKLNAEQEPPKIKNGIGVISYGDLKNTKQSESPMLQLAAEFLKIQPPSLELGDETQIVFAPFVDKFKIDLSSTNIKDDQKTQLANAFNQYLRSFADQKIHPPLTIAKPPELDTVFFNSNILSLVETRNPQEVFNTPAQEFDTKYGLNGESISTEYARDLSYLGLRSLNRESYPAHRKLTKAPFESRVDNLIARLSERTTSLAQVTN